MDDYEPIIDEAKDFLKFCNDADSNNRQEALEDLKFVNGDQWPVELQNSRNLESRPVLTINKLDTYCRQVTNQQRQQRPRIKVHATNTQADQKTAQVISGIVRHVEVNSNADHAYDNGFDYAVRMGWGYWRVNTKYVREDSFDQEIFIDPVDNPFTVYWDPNSIAPDGSDAEKCLITTMMPKEVFRQQFPGFDDGTSFTQRGTGDSQSEWITKEDIRLAEYFYTVREKATLYHLSDGTMKFADGKDFFERISLAGMTVIDERPSFKKTIKWKKMTAIEVIEERDWPGRYIPVVPVYGRHVVIGNKRKKFGMIRHAKDPQRMYNFWQTSLTESIALAPKAKWIMAEGQDEGHENEWAQANVKSTPYLRYKQRDIDGQPAPPPTRLQPEPPPAGVITAASTINDDLQAIMGIFDPNQIPTGNISGKALNGQQQQIDLTNFDYYDNLTRSISHTGKIILDLIPKIYDSERVMRIIGDDGKPELITLNERTAVGKVLNDVTVGEYDVVMETGPGYNSKRQEAVDSMMGMLSADPSLMQTAGDLIFRNMDFPGADIIADRLATLNPLSQVDDKSPIPPQVQMQLAQSQQQMQQMAQQIQQLQMMIKQRQDIEQIKQDNETKRELMKQTAKAHDIEMSNETKRRDVDVKVMGKEQDTKLMTDTMIEIENIKGQFALLLSHIDAAARRGAARETEERAI